MGAVIRGKFRVVRVTRHMDDKGEVESEMIGLNVVTDDSAENKQWSKWTPAGALEMTITNPAAYGKVTRGQEFYIDLISVEKK
jgi:hypothetical protein